MKDNFYFTKQILRRFAIGRAQSEHRTLSLVTPLVTAKTLFTKRINIQFQSEETKRLTVCGADRS